MSDLISREATIKAVVNGLSIKPSETVVRGIIEAIPAADAKTHCAGKWVLDPDGIDWDIPAWKCSICGCRNHNIGVVDKGFGRNPLTWAGSKYCPNCGARMDGEE